MCSGAQPALNTGTTSPRAGSTPVPSALEGEAAGCCAGFENRKCLTASRSTRPPSAARKTNRSWERASLEASAAAQAVVVRVHRLPPLESDVARCHTGLLSRGAFGRAVRLRHSPLRGRSPTAETGGLNPLQCSFESSRPHRSAHSPERSPTAEAAPSNRAQCPFESDRSDSIPVATAATRPLKPRTSVRLAHGELSCTENYVREEQRQGSPTGRRHYVQTVDSVGSNPSLGTMYIYHALVAQLVDAQG